MPFPALTYADFADLTLPSPVVAHVRVTRVVRLKPKQAPNVAPGKSRFFVEADVVSLLKGAGGVPPAVTYLVDLPNGPGGKPIKIQKKSEFLVFASPVPGRPGELRLSAPDAHRIWSPAEGERVRQLIQESARPDAPPQISGIGRGFHVPGSLPGEGETQIFLQAADGRPISLNILRRPGERSRWAVALSEIVDDAAEPPVRDTLLWYRLACTLPPNLPPQSLADAEAAYHVMIRMDYQVVMQGLGPCARTRTR
ncbi:MAG TPA: hypothetical protein VGD10_07760 [Allosphingosinicella sp.]|uniref:hypothetical protein n=1 Tax=Allosphingosinicella sp. TaxID=2823234 RepID=UPI002ED9340E